MELRKHKTKATTQITAPANRIQARRYPSRIGYRPDLRQPPDVTRTREASHRHGIMQLKVSVGQAGDPLEREAERIADGVIRTPGQHHPAVSSAPQQPSRPCQCGEGTQAKQAKIAGSQPASLAEAPPVVDDVLRAPGQPLGANDLEFFQRRFRHDFSHVQIHADRRAAESVHAVGARAYTVGSHVVFGAQEYAPATRDGRRLLAHELTHVVQQGPILRRQPISAPVIDSESGLLPDPAIASHGAKSPKARPPQPVPHPAERIPTATSASDGALKAISHAKSMHDQQDPALWFDSWGNDLRDNNMNGAIDEKAEQGISDGVHYGKTFSAKVCKDPSDTIDHCPPKDQKTIKVQYKVCIDIPIESYRAAGANISTSRWIPTFFSEMSKKPNWTVWKKPAAPPQLLDGDIVAADNAEHGHAGIVDTGLINNVINLPGPTSSRKFHLFNPSGTNDMVSVPRLLFESYLSIDWVARLNK